MEKYVLDTNLFFNLETNIGFGKKTEEVVINITQIAKRLKKNKKADFLMPPRAVDEFLSFFKDKNQQFIKEFLAVLTIKSPDVLQITITAPIFYLLIDEIRQRSYRGLNIGEEEIKKAGRLMVDLAKNTNISLMEKKEFEIKIGEIIRKFRQRYRTATRAGFIDSLTDMDLIMLTKEQEGVLISTDIGVLRWARVFGIKEIPAKAWREQLLHQG